MLTILSKLEKKNFLAQNLIIYPLKNVSRHVIEISSNYAINYRYQFNFFRIFAYYVRNFWRFPIKIIGRFSMGNFAKLLLRISLKLSQNYGLVLIDNLCWDNLSEFLSRTSLRFLFRILWGIPLLRTFVENYLRIHTGDLLEIWPNKTLKISARNFLRIIAANP